LLRILNLTNIGGHFLALESGAPDLKHFDLCQAPFIFLNVKDVGTLLRTMCREDDSEEFISHV
jgi:hypothetical protein